MCPKNAIAFAPAFVMEVTISSKILPTASAISPLFM